ncbi:hypothetical protein P7M47_04445 [Bisgaard Taxon 10/6]|uniref:Lipoprotein HlpB n=1 Tax=Exercitatus varius TaxID=67857 RepID=A0AAW6QAD1_9PAST|nr:hypothetical protein [Exercitatus varius]QOF66919.1 hypothetical protein IFE17_06975 [Actinobacillus sp. GY-402]MDG2915228.1 hypothetical protein [Exercitatus varius]MDG2940168.1 hypothetical protein [Exercitatus varius]MDG2942306.1 hypothetical protein [Exercitatus varius]MDG2944530.1 hypothetical protein [Exercitatus varius]
MKNLLKMGAVALFAVTLAACNNEDPKADYKKLVEWNQQQAEPQQKIVAELQQNIATAKENANAQAVDEAIKTYETATDAIIQSLDKVEVKSKEIAPFKAKTKDVLLRSKAVTSAGAKAAITQPSPEEMQKIQGEVADLQKAVKEFADLGAELDKKYGEKPAPAAK